MFRNLNTAELHQRFKSAQPFPFICIDDFLEPEWAREMARSYPDFETAKSIGLEFNADFLQPGLERVASGQLAESQPVVGPAH